VKRSSQIAMVDFAVGGTAVRRHCLRSISFLYGKLLDEHADRRTARSAGCAIQRTAQRRTEYARPCAARTLYALPKTATQTARTNRGREFAQSVLPLTRSDANQGSPDITRVYSTVTLGVVATPKTGTAVVGPLAASPM